MSLLLLIILILLALPEIAHAGGGGGGSETHSDLAPKSEELKALESQMYGISDQMMNAYTGQLNPNGTMTPAIKRGTISGAEDTVRKPGGLKQKEQQAYLESLPAKMTNGSNSAVSAGKDGNGGTVIPQPYDNNTLMGQLLNDATAKTYNSNERYDTLLGQAPELTAQSQAALGQANSLLGQGVNAVNQSKTAGDWYFNQAQGGYGNAQNYLTQAGTAGDPYYNQAQTDFGNAQNYLNQAGTAGDPYYDQARGNFTNAQNYLNQAGIAGDPWYSKAQETYGTAESLMGDLRNNLDYTSKSNQWYDDYTRDMLGNSKNLLETGQIPQPIINAVTSMMTQGVNKSLGSTMNDLAARGVINSSVSNRATADMSKSLSDSLMGGYMDAFNSMLSGYNQTAQTGASAGKAFADTSLNINNSYSDAMKNAISLGDSYGKTGSMKVSDLLGVAGGYTDNANSLVNAGSSKVNDLLGVAGGYTSNAGALMDAGDTRVNNMLNIASGYTNNANSLMDAGSQRISDWLNIGKGYNDSAAGYGTLSQGYLSNLDANLKERDQLLAAIPQYYKNAMAPMMPSYDLMQTMQQDHWNSDKQTTVVSQGGGGLS
jgi:hypothetical protein